jgi:hypothetical protein
MHIIKIQQADIIPLTVDTIDFTSDDTSITADLTEVNISGHIIKVIPREYHDNVVIKMKNSLTSKQYVLECSTFNEGYFMNVIINHIFKVNETYDFDLTTLDNKLLYRGTIYVIDQDSTQDYKLNKPDNDIIKI